MAEFKIPLRIYDIQCPIHAGLQTFVTNLLLITDYK
nr:MAG TPA: hypothetical protein [Caudoviricetes sp.]